MGKYGYLIKNMGLLTLSSFATKLLSFFLVPLYTNILTTSEYGEYDLFNTTVSLLVPILTLDIQEAVMRFSIDKGSDSRGIFTIGTIYGIISCIIVALGIGVNALLGLSDVLLEYSVFFILFYVTSTFSGIFSYFARGIGKIGSISISSVISSAVTIALNILFLVVFKWGIAGFFLAHIIGISVSIFYLFISLKYWRYWKYKGRNATLEKEMRRYSTPLIANAVSWWVNNVSDRYVVTWILGVSVNGIYSVAYKIPSIISLVQYIFGQAWTLSAIKDYDETDQSGFFSNTYGFYNMILVLVCSFLMLADKIVAKCLFAKDFYEAWEYVPFLLIGIVFSGLASYFGGILSALKKTGTFAKTSTISALINTVFNIVLVWQIGALGAAISTAIAYFVMWMLRYKEVRKHSKMVIQNAKNLGMYFLLVIQATLLVISDGSRLIDLHQIILFIMIVAINFNNILRYMKMSLAKVKRGKT